ncbi:hypothetical protein BC834DRAFT_968969 [Gloeopeniophorella convolvens]|nr:hypothetical protein BC834DRAFT_968969 [Gloeopeniophorella convolvens]
MADGVADPAEAHTELREQLREMQLVRASIEAYQPAISRPPILDSSLDAAEKPDNQLQRLSGLRPLLDAVRRISMSSPRYPAFLAGPDAARLPPPSTNAPYLVAVWNEHRRGPEAQERTRRQGDVVADNGRTWIRVNTAKNARLLAEFRELDSYLTDGSSDDEDTAAYPPRAPPEFDNSLLRAARALLAAARANPVPGTTAAPRVTLRLPRLDPAPPADPRIAQTLQTLRAMGLAVALGAPPAPLPPQVSAEPPARAPRPTRRISLDLSVLIALVSDLTHAPLPATRADPHARFVPSPAYVAWKQARVRAKPDGEAEAEAEIDSAQHSRALAEQLQQEMQRGLLDELRAQLGSAEPESAVEFWTTREARARCLRIVAKVGGPGERRRARVLFPADDDSADGDEALEARAAAYWAHSRHARLPLLPIRIFPADDPAPDPGTEDHGAFFAALAATCRALLATPAPDPPAHADADADADAELQRAPLVPGTARLTAHTVHSALCGAARGWTTLTANRGSVRALLRAMRERGLDARGAGASAGGEAAALWVVDPRSLAEGMRADFGGAPA